MDSSVELQQWCNPAAASAAAAASQMSLVQQQQQQQMQMQIQMHIQQQQQQLSNLAPTTSSHFPSDTEQSNIERSGSTRSTDSDRRRSMSYRAVMAGSEDGVLSCSDKESTGGSFRDGEGEMHAMRFTSPRRDEYETLTAATSGIQGSLRASQSQPGRQSPDSVPPMLTKAGSATPADQQQQQQDLFYQNVQLQLQQQTNQRQDGMLTYQNIEHVQHPRQDLAQVRKGATEG